MLMLLGIHHQNHAYLCNRARPNHDCVCIHCLPTKSIRAGGSHADYHGEPNFCMMHQC